MNPNQIFDAGASRPRDNGQIDASNQRMTAQVNADRGDAACRTALGVLESGEIIRYHFCQVEDLLVQSDGQINGRNEDGGGFIFPDPRNGLLES